MVNKKAIVLVAILILVFTINFNEVSASWFNEIFGKVRNVQLSPEVSTIEPSIWLDDFLKKIIGKSPFFSPSETCLNFAVAVPRSDVNRDGDVNLIDMAFVKSKNGCDAGAIIEEEKLEECYRFDTNVDGSVNLIDMALVKSLNGCSITDAGTRSFCSYHDNYGDYCLIYKDELYNYKGREYSIITIGDLNTVFINLDNAPVGPVYEGNTYQIENLELKVKKIGEGGGQTFVLFKINEVQCEETCSNLEFECGDQFICGESVNCGVCSDGYSCISGSCVLLQENSCINGACIIEPEEIIEISSCEDSPLNQPFTTYSLINDLPASGDCLSIEANYVTIDGNGFSITGDGTGKGITSFRKNSTEIKNLTIKEFSTGISFHGVNDVWIQNVRVNENTNDGIYIGDSVTSTKIILKNSEAKNNGLNGLIFHSKVENSVIENNDISYNNNYGILFNSETQNNQVIGNIINENNKAGIRLSGQGFGRNNLVKRNIIAGNAWYGLDSSGTSDSIFEENVINFTKSAVDTHSGIFIFQGANNIIRENTIENNARYGVYSSSSNNLTVINNTIKNNVATGIAYSSTKDVEIINNLIEENDNGITGAQISQSGKSTISNNKISNNRAKGISLTQGAESTITNNDISSNVEDGIYLSATSNNSILNNKILNNKNGIYLKGSSASSLSENNFIEGNLIEDSLENGIILNSYTRNNLVIGNRIFRSGLWAIIINSLQNRLNKIIENYGIDNLAGSIKDYNGDNTISENCINDITCEIPAPSCGDLVCDPTDSCSSCPLDCGECAPICGDNKCSGLETCSTCSSDCGDCEVDCPGGTVIDGVCWHKSNSGQSCNDVCSNQGKVCVEQNWNDDFSCSVCNILFPGSVTCDLSATGFAPFFSNSNGGACMLRLGEIPQNCALSPSADEARLCICSQEICDPGTGICVAAGHSTDFYDSSSGGKSVLERQLSGIACATHIQPCGFELDLQPPEDRFSCVDGQWGNPVESSYCQQQYEEQQNPSEPSTSFLNCGGPAPEYPEDSSEADLPPLPSQQICDYTFPSDVELTALNDIYRIPINLNLLNPSPSQAYFAYNPEDISTELGTFITEGSASQTKIVSTENCGYYSVFIDHEQILQSYIAPFSHVIGDVCYQNLPTPVNNNFPPDTDSCKELPCENCCDIENPEVDWPCTLSSPAFSKIYGVLVEKCDGDTFTVKLDNNRNPITSSIINTNKQGGGIYGECLGRHEVECIDNDNDGYFAHEECEGPADCDDNDNKIYPGAEEICDGEDNDCDGQTDEYVLANNNGNPRHCSGIEQCVRVGKKVVVDSETTNLLGIGSDLMGFKRTTECSFSPGVSSGIPSERKDAECHEKWIFESVSSYPESFFNEENWYKYSELRGWEKGREIPGGFPQDPETYKIQKVFSLTNCMPQQESAIIDSWNGELNYNEMAVAQTVGSICDDWIKDETTKWDTYCTLKDKCQDGVDNNGDKLFTDHNGNPLLVLNGYSANVNPETYYLGGKNVDSQDPSCSCIDEDGDGWCGGPEGRDCVDNQAEFDAMIAQSTGAVGLFPGAIARYYGDNFEPNNLAKYINPGMREVNYDSCYDGIDNDCNGEGPTGALRFDKDPTTGADQKCYIGITGVDTTHGDFFCNSASEIEKAWDEGFESGWNNGCSDEVLTEEQRNACYALHYGGSVILILTGTWELAWGVVAPIGEAGVTWLGTQGGRFAAKDLAFAVAGIGGFRYSAGYGAVALERILVVDLVKAQAAAVSLGSYAGANAVMFSKFSGESKGGSCLFGENLQTSTYYEPSYIRNPQTEETAAVKGIRNDKVNAQGQTERSSYWKTKRTKKIDELFTSLDEIKQSDIATLDKETIDFFYARHFKGFTTPDSPVTTLFNRDVFTKIVDDSMKKASNQVFDLAGAEGKFYVGRYTNTEQKLIDVSIRVERLEIKTPGSGEGFIPLNRIKHLDLEFVTGIGS